MSKFTDNTKLGIDPADLESVRALRKELAAIREWSTVWQMPFNIDKCYVLHVATAKYAVNNSLLGLEIPNVTQERDLGVINTADLKSFVQCITEEQ